MCVQSSAKDLYKNVRKKVLYQQLFLLLLSLLKVRVILLAEIENGRLHEVRLIEPHRITSVWLFFLTDSAFCSAVKAERRK